MVEKVNIEKIINNLETYSKDIDIQNDPGYCYAITKDN